MATPPLTRQRPTVQAGGIRRSFTQPPRSLSFHERAGLDPSDSAAVVLYSHPRARIVSFTPATDAVRSVSSPHSIDLDYPVDTIETLPWKSYTEEVLASGSLIIEKIRGSTNFLKSGSKPLHALMKNSQCWCVDGEATLVMRVGAFKYYRIELPFETEAEKAEVQKLKEVLQRILRFEATPCPFKRGFHVDLPESATTPRKKGPWKRRPGSLLSSPSSPSPSPLSLRKTRVRNTEQEQEEQIEAESLYADSKNMNGDGIGESPCSEDDYQDNPHDNTTGDDDIDAVTESDLQNGHQITDASSSLTSTADEYKDQPNEPRDDGRDEPGTTDNHLASELPNTEETSETHDSDLEHQLEGLLDIDQARERVEVGNAMPASSGIGCSEDVELKSTERSLNLPDDNMGNTSSASTSSDLVPDHFLNKKVVTPNCSDKPAEHADLDTSDVLSSLDDKAQNFQENGTTDYDHGAKAEHVAPIADDDEGAGAGKVEEPDKAAREPAESGENSAFQTADTNESVPVSPRFHAPVTNRDSTIENSQERKNLDSLDDLASEVSPLQVGSPLSDTVSMSSCADSFHSVASAGYDSPLSVAEEVDSSDPTPLVEAHDHFIPSHAHLRQDVSNMTATTDSASLSGPAVLISPLRPSAATSDRPSTPPLLRSSASDTSWPEVETPMAKAPDNQLRRRLKMKRSFSPPPPSSILLPSSPQSPRGSHLTGAILQKAYNLALSKPIEVISMLFHILARIASGATYRDLMNDDMFRQPEALPSEARQSHGPPTHTESHTDEISDEDDYGVPIRGRRRSRSQSVAPVLQNDDDVDSLFDLD